MRSLYPYVIKKGLEEVTVEELKNNKLVSFMRLKDSTTYPCPCIVASYS